MTAPLPELPHAPYIDAIVTALTDAGCAPDSYWTSGAEDNVYEPDAATTMLTAVIAWRAPDGDDSSRDGLLLVWDHPAEEWQYAAALADGSNREPEFLPGLPRFAAPAAVAAAARALLAGEVPAAEPAPEWREAAPVRAAVTAWDAA